MTRYRVDDRGSTTVGFALGLVTALLLAAGGALVDLLHFGSQDQQVQDDGPQVTEGTQDRASVTASADPSPSPDASSSTEDATATAPPSAAPEPTFAETYEDVASGVVRVETTGCDASDGGTGSGALVGADLVLTAAHVVQRHSSVQLVVGGQSAQGQVVGFSLEDDLALVRASRPLTGHEFELVDPPPSVGTEVVALGYALAGPLSMAGPGIISTYGEESSIQADDGSLVTVEDVMRTTVPTNRGNSGGPIVDVEGRIVGVVSTTAASEGTVNDDGSVDVHVVQGMKYAIPAQRARERLADWSSTPQPLDPAVCDEPDISLAGALVTTQEVSQDADAVVAVLHDFFEGINHGDYERAYRQWASQLREGTSLERFAADHSTTLVSSVVVLGTRREGEDLHAIVTFASHQAPELGPDNLPCVFWTLEYRFVPGGDHGWAIRGTDEVQGQPQFEACTDVAGAGEG